MEALWAMRVVFWFAAGSVAVIASAVNRSGGRQQRAMLLWGGLITYLLAYDEAMHLHDELATEVIGCSEQLICSMYALLAMMWLARFRTAMPAPPVGWLVGSIALFAGAIAMEQVPMPQQAVVVGALKLLGVACWGGFFARCAVEQFRAGGKQLHGQLLSLSQHEQVRMSQELDATSATIAELTAMAKDAASRRSEGSAARSRAPGVARKLSAPVESVRVR